MSDPGRRDRGILDKVGGRRRPDAIPWSRRLWRWLYPPEQPTASLAYSGLYEDLDDPERTGVCCSGGGIRSAAFNLGALQALEQHGVLQKTDYLSAVSGGSYIASALCMVAKTGDTGAGFDTTVFNERNGMPLGPGTPEEQYLRNHLSYLAPDGPAKVYLGLRMLAGLLVNVLLIGLPVFIAGLVVGLAFDGAYDGLADGGIDVPKGILYPLIGVTATALLLAMVDILWRPRKDRWQTATEVWEVRLFVLAVLAAVALVAIPWLAAKASGFDTSAAGSATHGVWVSFVTAASSLAALGGAAIAHLRGAVKDAERVVKGAESKLGGYAGSVRHLLVATAVTLAGPLLLVAVATLGVLISAQRTDNGIAILVGAGVVLGALWLVTDLTTVSLHPFYRRRLAAAFALERVGAGKGATARERPFDELVALPGTDVGPGWPMLIVCAAANVSDPGVTPPGRRVASFTFSPAAIGGPLTGATEASRYEALGRNRRRDVTLPAAVAMSGAAVSPTMGKLTRRPLIFLLALANIRLGVWVANPRHINAASDATGRPSKLTPSGPGLARRSPEQRASLWHRPRPHYLWKELLGRNRLDDKFLYITDGGHYENLGLLELLRRGCRTVYCFDAGGGKTSKALGDAIALARTELDVEIRMSPDVAKLAEDENTHRSQLVCACGTICYPGETPSERIEGRLFYVRSVVTEKSPWELQDYQLEDGIFPHHSTLDQFFTDQRFEAYRRLGTWAAESAIGMEEPPSPHLQAVTAAQP